MYGIPVLLLFLVTGCGENQRQKSEKPEVVQPEVTVDIPDFNADSAYSFIEKQVGFGPRVPNTQAHRDCGDWLVRKLASYHARVEEQPFRATAFDGTPLQLRNIIATFYPDRPKRILLAAHWDTRPFADQDTERTEEPILGANDGASGVAVILEIARLLQDHSPISAGIDIIFFDGEDYGETDTYESQTNAGETYWCLGSQHWSANKHKPGYSAYYGILLDMVGARNAKFYKEGTSRYFAPVVVERIWKAAKGLGYGNYFIMKDSPEIMDDHVFVNHIGKINMIDIIEYDPNNASTYFADYWHTHRDNLEVIDPRTLEAVGETVTYVILNE